LPGSPLASQPGLKAIDMWWLEDIVIPMLLVAGVCSFVMIVRSRTRTLTHPTDRTAEGMYPLYDDSARKHRKHGGRDDPDG
jgi:hypothetical protein